VLRAAEAALHLADLEPRALGGDHEVAGLGERVAKPQGIAVDGGDHRLPVDGVGEAVLARAAPGRPAEPSHLLWRAELALLHVGAGAEGAAGAGQDRHLQIQIGVELEQRVVDLLHQLVGGGVELLRPVQRDAADRSRLLVEHRLERGRRVTAGGHGPLLSRWSPLGVAGFYCRRDMRGNETSISARAGQVAKQLVPQTLGAAALEGIAEGLRQLGAQSPPEARIDRARAAGAEQDQIVDA
jgi:hypothetical protein